MYTSGLITFIYIYIILYTYIICLLTSESSGKSHDGNEQNLLAHIIIHVVGSIGLYACSKQLN